MNIASFAPLAVLLPILGAALTFLLIRHSRAQRTVSIAVLSADPAARVLAAGLRLGRRHRGGEHRRLAPALGHRHGGGPVLLTDAGGVLLGEPGRADLRHRAGHGRRRPGRPGLDLPPHLPDPGGRRVQRLPLRGPVQPLCGLRDPADRELRADDPRRDGSADPGRCDLRGGLRGVLRAVPDRDRHDLRGHRNHQHGRPRPQARGAGPGHAEPAARHAARGVRDQGRRVPAVLLAAGLLPDGAGPGHGRVRRPADQGGRVRHGPDRNAAVPRRHVQLRR